MTRTLSNYDEQSQLRALREGGWCAFEEALSPREVRRTESLLQGFIDGLDPARLSGFGATIYALAAREPRMNPFYRDLSILPFMQRALGDAITLRRTGARISGQASQERILWHHHHGWTGDELAQRTGFERLLFICYLEGTRSSHGALVIRPRGFTDPFEEAPERLFDPLPGEVQLDDPPGTVVVMDAPVLHSALRGKGDELRMICGAHVQARSLERAHPEDDPPLDRLRAGARHRSFRWGLRDGRRWLQKANQAPLPNANGY